MKENFKKRRLRRPPPQTSRERAIFGDRNVRSWKSTRLRAFTIRKFLIQKHNGIWISLFITWLSSIALMMSIYSYTFDFCTFKNYTFKIVIFKSGFFRLSRHFWFLPFQKLHFWKWVDRLWSFQYILIDVTLCLFCNHDNGTYLKMRFEWVHILQKHISLHSAHHHNSSFFKFWHQK